ncbi:hypothetical protein N7537_011250 [Penicillium hordei]|uniref:Uncharacterized protein n=1 Tax=Penicillium hordei TaxID=40994 RepID=A0AAD6GTF8_9EURO|nr:uncharacterized protein N7537_011250 [Penicillium hordei]KAJ5588572.1 hypothetical protein N7537_011250 [Penicillium hordei]
MIECVGSGPSIPLKLCVAILRGEAEDIGETEEEFLDLKEKRLQNDLLVSIFAGLRSLREIVQHAEAASYIISQLCIHD